MIKDEKLSLPDNWEAVLELMMLKRPVDSKCERIYICSPCRAETSDGVIRNMKAARIYMFYAYTHFACVPIAPHAYVPILLSDISKDERELALWFGKEALIGCDKLFICGNRLTDGMFDEIERALITGIDVTVFHQKVYDELRERIYLDDATSRYLRFDAGHLHFALAWGADELAPYWEGL